MKNLIKMITKRIKLTLESLGENEGFSLLEILIVLVIIGILSTIVYTRFMDLPEKARISAASQQIGAFKLALQRYNMDNNGSYPTQDQGLESIKVYLESKTLPNDPWGTPYVYRIPGENENEYEVISLGPDKQENTADDIKSSDLHKWSTAKPKKDEIK
jgi:general secretion pathway protein G